MLDSQIEGSSSAQFFFKVMDPNLCLYPNGPDKSIMLKELGLKKHI